MPELRARKSAACALAGLLFVLTACNGNGELDGEISKPYGGASSASASSGDASTGELTFDDFLRFSNSGDIDNLLSFFQDSDDTDLVALSAADISLTPGGSVTLAITGAGIKYSQDATASDDGMVYFQVPKPAIGKEVTVSIVVKMADGTVLYRGSRTQVIQSWPSLFSVNLLLEEFVRVPGNGSVPSLYVCIHEVTQKEFAHYCYQSRTYDKGAGDRYPAYYVSWYDTLVYCNLRSMAESLTPCYRIGGSTDPADWSGIVSSDGKYCGPSVDSDAWNVVTCDFNADGYRLPTSAEWEYIARGGPAYENYTYAGSDDIDAVSWWRNNSADAGGSTRSHEVMGKQPNSLGIYDLSGNEYEWCWDPYAAGERAERGGSWNTTAPYHEVLSVRGYSYFGKSFLLGFRLVRTVRH